MWKGFDSLMLTVSNISKQFRGADTPILKNISFTVNAGERVGLIGPNGSGKSTMLRIAAEIIEPSEGRVQWAERARRQYYDQHQDEVLDTSNTVIGEVRSVAKSEPDVRRPCGEGVALLLRVLEAEAVNVARAEDDLNRLIANPSAAQPDERAQTRRQKSRV